MKLIDVKQIPKSIDGHEFHRFSEVGIQLMNPTSDYIKLYSGLILDFKLKTKRLKRGPK